MTLKQTIIASMTVKQLRKVARKLELHVEDYRKRGSLAGSIRRAQRATAEILLDCLSEQDVKRLCELRDIESVGRKQVLIRRLLASEQGNRTADEVVQQSGDRSGHRRHGTRGQGRSTATAPDLRFGPSTDRTGFTPAGIAGFSDLRPEPIVRELIQNSLDATLIEAKEDCARVQFRRSTCTLDDIPGIESYRCAFRKAFSERPPSGGARAVVKRIRQALDNDSHEVLSVTDNGVGLDGRRISALLSDGISAKGSNTSGTFGNGHSVVVPASNLRYVLYGGLTMKGRRFGAGQAVLASHSVRGESYGRSGRGLYVVSFERESGSVPFTLARENQIPPIVSAELDRIHDRHGHGAAVVIPAFNDFGSKPSLWETVSCAAAFNFFQAIHERRLVVEVEDPNDPDGVRVLDVDELPAVLRPCREEMRKRRGGLLSGRTANEAYEALVEGESHQIKIRQGKVEIRLLCRKAGRRSVGLCRNGMWVTDDLPTFRNAFTDRQPFQALILLSSDREDAFYELIREAETPLHNKLALSQMDPERRKALRDALQDIGEQICELVPKSTSDSYSPDDILSFQFNDIEGQGRGGRQPSLWGRVTSFHRPTAARHRGEKGESGSRTGGQGSRNGTGRSQQDRAVAEPIFRIASVPAGSGKRTVHVECDGEFKDAELRVFVDENVDATCDRQTRTQETAVLLSNATMNGRRLEESEFVRDGDDAVGAKLGSLSENAQLVLELEYVVPDSEMPLLRGVDPTLRIEILGSQMAHGQEDSEGEGGVANG